VDEVALSKAVHPVLKGKERTMIKTIFEEKYDEGVALGEARGVALGEARGKIEAVLTVLRTRFHRIPKDVETAIRQMTDPISLDSWTAQAATCQSMDEFAEALL
jgi:flagellar biosynthesis/type III secretory pathway protein FliH